MSEIVYAIWDKQWGDEWFLYEIGEKDDGFYSRCVDAHTGETLALGLGDSVSEAYLRALSELLSLAREEA